MVGIKKNPPSFYTKGLHSFHILSFKAHAVKKISEIFFYSLEISFSGRILKR